MFTDLKTMLRYYQSLGFDSIPIASEDYENGSVNFTADKGVLLGKIKEEIANCVRCKLSKYRKKIVFGEGTPEARLLFIGEAPGREEDIQGMPFVGEAGMLLTRLIEKMGLKRNDVYITNVIKCRPPMNRDPEDDEIETCMSILEKQVEIIKPEMIITLGRIALQSTLANSRLKITLVRGNFFEYKGIPVMPTFHPAYLLRNPKDKWLTWSDVQKVMERMKLSGH
jgi:DNA polymerase